jgi:hypothetical protein
LVLDIVDLPIFDILKYILILSDLTPSAIFEVLKTINFNEHSQSYYVEKTQIVSSSYFTELPDFSPTKLLMIYTFNIEIIK